MNLTSNTNLKQIGKQRRAGLWLTATLGSSQTGVFGISRNPIFLGMIITLIGFILTIPNALTFLELILGFVFMQIQVRMEGEFLIENHGVDYENFCRQVRRLL